MGDPQPPEALMPLQAWQQLAVNFARALTREHAVEIARHVFARMQHDPSCAAHLAVFTRLLDAPGEPLPAPVDDVL